MKYKLILSIVLVMLSFSIVTVYAQPGDPGGDPDNSNPVPITGIEYLIAAGAAFGAKKLYDKKRK